MPIDSSYTPQYVDLDDIPLSGPDDYSATDKRKALYEAEGSLELDVNGGSPIAQHEVFKAHRIAVMNLGTHVLTKGASDPSSVTLGDMASNGSERTEYASQYLERYNELIDGIVSDGSKSGKRTVSVNSTTGTSTDSSNTKLFD